ncbi:hypothetical protein VP01_9837g1 [Puccinia sorghi]|uniref:Uncharacterized protein n=1 Tax=Puccinia sorghi TaxID=27349 RepID=A0A0L6U5M4_9BASI|nr:hypothetical protein VP01_9837g1 [Puccinia sorghi]
MWVKNRITTLPTPTLTVVLMLFSRSDQTTQILQILAESNVKIRMVEVYCPEQCWVIPHSLHLEHARRSSAATLLHARITGINYHLLILAFTGLRLAPGMGTKFGQNWKNQRTYSSAHSRINLGQ